jgi:fructose/tagatose bisphosphate aldolase
MAADSYCQLLAPVIGDFKGFYQLAVKMKFDIIKTIQDKTIIEG